MRIVTIIGARPQFIKAAMVSRAIIKHNENSEHIIEELLVHTGQHYDENMSTIFFNDMGLPQPYYQFQCGNASHAEMTAKMLTEIEKVLLESSPDYVLVYGDTNSTLAGALAASKIHIPIIHVEAGLRSYNKNMPEEINRILTDHLSSVLCCPTQYAINCLAKEGIQKGVYYVGDVMHDAALVFGEISDAKSIILSTLSLESKQFYLCTIHRAENTNQPERLKEILEALTYIANKDCPVILPVHPRTQHFIKAYNLIYLLESNPYIRVIDPVGFLDMVQLEKHARIILTDSGGIQKEAYFHKTPCITLRDETEWVETIEAGWNQLAGYRKENILNCLENSSVGTEISEYGSGKAAEEIINLL